MIVGVVNGIVGVIAMYGDDAPVVITGVLTVDIHSVVNVVGAVVLSLFHDL